MKHFKTLKSIQTAEVEELTQILPRNIALAVYRNFHGEEQGK